MKLELKHLAPYLPYQLKITHPLGVFNITGLRETDMQMALLENESDVLWGYLYESKPILRPMSDLRNETECKQLVNFVKYGNYKNLPVWLFEDLIKQHFDVFGLIDNGLAIDINTIKTK